MQFSYIDYLLSMLWYAYAYTYSRLSYQTKVISWEWLCSSPIRRTISRRASIYICRKGYHALNNIQSMADAD